jgi:hypothetical protein
VEQEEQRPAWAVDIQAFYDGLYEPLRVLVWGPGEGGNPEWFEKRKHVIEALKAQSPDDEVRTSEELLRETHNPPLESGYLEMVHAHEADVIIAIVLGPPDKQGGVYRELEIIAQHENLLSKVFIFLPAAKRWIERFHAGMLDRYLSEQKVQLSWPDIQECQKMRAISISRVEEQRKKRMYRKLDARIRSGE